MKVGSVLIADRGFKDAVTLCKVVPKQVFQNFQDALQRLIFETRRRSQKYITANRAFAHGADLDVFQYCFRAQLLPPLHTQSALPCCRTTQRGKAV
jgi:hypothetical protein